MKIPHTTGFVALISLTLIITACGPTVPQKTENIKKVQEAMPSSLAAMQEMRQGLTPKTEKALMGLNFALPTLPLFPLDPNDPAFLTTQKALIEAAGAKINALIQPQGTPQDPDEKLERGTYQRDADGIETKISDEPKNGKVVQFTEEGIPFTETVIYNEIVVLSSTSDGESIYEERLLDYQTTLVSENETLFTATINQDGTKCTYQDEEGMTREDLLLRKADAVLNVADQIQAKGNLNVQGKQITASGELNVNTDKHKLAVKGNVGITTRAEPACGALFDLSSDLVTEEPFALLSKISDVNVNVNMALDNNTIDLMASLKNFGSNMAGVFGDVDAKLVYSTPQYYANLFTAKGKLQDGPDPDTKGGDQLDITLVLPKFTISTNWQNLMELLGRFPLPMLDSVLD